MLKATKDGIEKHGRELPPLTEEDRKEIAKMFAVPITMDRYEGGWQENYKERMK